MELFSHCVFLLPSFLASSLTKSFIYGVSAVKSAEWGLGLFLLLYEIKMQYLVSQNLDPRHMTDRTLPVFYPDWNGHLEAILAKQHWLIPWPPEGTRKMMKAWHLSLLHACTMAVHAIIHDLCYVLTKLQTLVIILNHSSWVTLDSIKKRLRKDHSPDENNFQQDKIAHWAMERLTS